MDSAVNSPATRLDLASQALRAQLTRLTQGNEQSGSTVPDISGLLTAIDEYEQAVCVYLSPDSVEILSLTLEQLLAYRETQPLYRLGWVRGHKAGLAQAQRASESALSLYAQHTALPPPPDPTALIQQVRRFLATLQQRYGAGPIPYR